MALSVPAFMHHVDGSLTVGNIQLDISLSELIRICFLYFLLDAQSVTQSFLCHSELVALKMASVLI